MKKRLTSGKQPRTSPRPGLHLPMIRPFAAAMWAMARPEVAMRAAFTAVEKTGRWLYWCPRPCPSALRQSCGTVRPFPARVTNFRPQLQAIGSREHDTRAGLVCCAHRHPPASQKDVQLGSPRASVINDEEQWFTATERFPVAQPKSTFRL